MPKKSQDDQVEDIDAVDVASKPIEPALDVAPDTVDTSSDAQIKPSKAPKAVERVFARLLVSSPLGLSGEIVEVELDTPQLTRALARGWAVLEK